MDVKTLKDFEKKLQTKINHEFEIERKTNDNLSRILLVGGCDMWKRIKDGGYKWLKINDDKKSDYLGLLRFIAMSKSHDER